MVFSFTATGNSLYAATHFSDAPEFTARLAAEAGFRADYVSAIQMVDNFYLEGGRAKRKQSTCEFCLACAQNCPQKAIGLRLADKHPRARCRNPHISLQEIIDANNHEEKGVLSHDDPHAE